MHPSHKSHTTFTKSLSLKHANQHGKAPPAHSENPSYPPTTPLWPCQRATVSEPFGLRERPKEPLLRPHPASFRALFAPFSLSINQKYLTVNALQVPHFFRISSRKSCRPEISPKWRPKTCSIFWQSENDLIISIIIVWWSAIPAITVHSMWNKIQCQATFYPYCIIVKNRINKVENLDIHEFYAIFAIIKMEIWGLK